MMMISKMKGVSCFKNIQHMSNLYDIKKSKEKSEIIGLFFLEVQWKIIIMMIYLKAIKKVKTKKQLRVN
jgi:hypothetical protein